MALPWPSHAVEPAVPERGFSDVLFYSPALPDFASVRAAWRSSDTRILSIEGIELQRIRRDFSSRRGDWVPLGDISAALQRAVIHSEDRRFTDHAGVDWLASAAAAWATATGGAARGASTLSMQLVALLDPALARAAGGRSWPDKLAQMQAARALEARWTKAQILEAYLNLVPWQGEIVGVDALARVLFRKSAVGLNLREAALAAVWLRGPNAAVATQARRACQLLRELGRPQDCQALRDLLPVVQARASGRRFASAGLAPHLARLVLTGETSGYWHAAGPKIYSATDVVADTEKTRDENGTGPMPGIVDGSVINAKKIGGEYAIGLGIATWQKSRTNPEQKKETVRNDSRIVDGLEQQNRLQQQVAYSAEHREVATYDTGIIKTTLRADLQKRAVHLVQQHLRDLRGTGVTDAAVVVLDNASGAVLAYVGSSGVLSDAAQVDHARALRQAGSTLKPFLYAQALDEQRLTAASLLDDRPVNLAAGSGLYVPDNYDHRYAGWVSVRTALASSLNIPAVRTLLMLGPQPFADRLRALGLPLRESGDYYGYSLALGSADVSLLSLSNAYRTLARGGRYQPPHLLPLAPDVSMTGRLAADTAKQVFPRQETWQSGNGSINDVSHISDQAVGKSKQVFPAGSAWMPGKPPTPDTSRATGLADQTKQIFSPEAAWLVGDILADANARVRTFGLDSPLATRFWSAVKTGTSRDMRDNWCLGWSAQYTVGVWVGNSAGASMRDVSGVTGAGPIWHDLMKWLHDHDSGSEIMPANAAQQGGRGHKAAADLPYPLPADRVKAEPLPVLVTTSRAMLDAGKEDRRHAAEPATTSAAMRDANPEPRLAAEPATTSAAMRDASPESRLAAGQTTASAVVPAGQYPVQVEVGNQTASKGRTAKLAGPADASPDKALSSQGALRLHGPRMPAGIQAQHVRFGAGLEPPRVEYFLADTAQDYFAPPVALPATSETVHIARPNIPSAGPAAQNETEALLTSNFRFDEPVVAHVEQSTSSASKSRDFRSEGTHADIDAQSAAAASKSRDFRSEGTHADIDAQSAAAASKTRNLRAENTDADTDAQSLPVAASVRIAQPVDGTVIALDPDIPGPHQMLLLQARDVLSRPVASVRWYLNGEPLLACRDNVFACGTETADHHLLVDESVGHRLLVDESAEHHLLVDESTGHYLLVDESTGRAFWSPQPGRHVFQIRDPDGRVLDQVTVHVRAGAFRVLVSGARSAEDP